MTVDQFSRCVEALQDFPTGSPPAQLQPGISVKCKVVGMIGGEPLTHPQFPVLAGIMAEMIPNREHRGLWTGLQWQRTRHADVIDEVFGFVNNNLHVPPCRHSPVLVAIGDVVSDPEERAKLINDCWLQRLWAGTCMPKGYFFCEVAGAMDMIFGGPGGLPIEPDCWRRPLRDFRDQVGHWCPRCGIPLNREGRIDSEEVDDVSAGNLAALVGVGSPRIRDRRFVLHNDTSALRAAVEKPWEYRP